MFALCTILYWTIKIELMTHPWTIGRGCPDGQREVSKKLLYLPLSRSPGCLCNSSKITHISYFSGLLGYRKVDSILVDAAAPRIHLLPPPHPKLPTAHPDNHITLVCLISAGVWSCQLFALMALMHLTTLTIYGSIHSCKGWVPAL